MIQIYCGNGKGKTTASLGLAIRAAGSGMHVHYVQFLKGGATSELEILARIPEITVMRCDRDYGFTYQMDDEKKAQITQCHNRMLAQITEQVQAGNIAFLVLDEFFHAYNSNLLDKALAESLVFHCPESMELILTGRYPGQKFLDIADYVSEIADVKHPYWNGIRARRGIEY